MGIASALFCPGFARTCLPPLHYAAALLRLNPVLLAFAHLACTKIGWLLIAGGAQATPVWPEAGFDIVALLLFGTRYWPVLLAANFVGILQEGIPWLPSSGAAIAAIGRALVGVWIFSALARLKTWVGHFFDLAAVALASLDCAGGIHHSRHSGLFFHQRFSPGTTLAGCRQPLLGVRFIGNCHHHAGRRWRWPAPSRIATGNRGAFRHF